MRLLSLVVFVLVSSAFAADEPSKSVFLIGNSLTWDTVPSKLSGDIQWHVDCGKSLKYIEGNPEAPCVKSSTLWPSALTEKQYDIISFQPHYGTTLQEDLATIGRWIERQPNAVVVIHTGWARQAERIEEASDTSAEGTLTHSRVYFGELLAELTKKHSGREFRSTGAMLLLEQIAADIEADKAPFDDISDLYRDAIHMNVHTGRYLMHNAMRQTLGQKRFTDWSSELTAEQQAYFDSLLDRQVELVQTLVPTR